MAKEMIRENLLVTIGSRAAYMHCAGDIELPSGTHGEDVLAVFASNLATDWISNHHDGSFDDFIETALIARFKK